MIEMSVSHQNRVHSRREMTHSIRNARNVRLNARTNRNAQKIHAREIRIDQQCVTFEFELVTVCAEISHAHATARTCGRIADNQLSIGTESCAKGLRGESQQKKERAFHRNDLYRVRAPQSDSNLLRKHSRFRGNFDSALRLSPWQGERIEVRGSRPTETIRLQQPCPSPLPYGGRGDPSAGSSLHLPQRGPRVCLTNSAHLVNVQCFK